MPLPAIDINADLGEHPGPSGTQIDDALLDIVTSANIACGFHAGTPSLMARTVEAAVERGVRIGAHPGLADRAHFGRRVVRLAPDDAYSMVLYQIGALASFTRRWNVRVTHVKPHGALYHMAEADEAIAQAIAYAVHDYAKDLQLVGLSGGRLTKAGRALGLSASEEVFADRAYHSNGTLIDRAEPASVIADPHAAARRMALLLATGAFPANDGTPLALHADTLCLHGDHPGAVERARILRSTLEASGIAVRAPAAL